MGMCILILIFYETEIRSSGALCTDNRIEHGEPDQRPSMILWSMVLLWSLFCLYQHRRLSALGLYGGLALQDGLFVNAKGCEVKLTPMQQQLMEMLWLSPSHKLSKTEICDALWPKKEDASETLYTLIRRLKPIIEEHSDLKIESDRGKTYGLKIK